LSIAGFAAELTNTQNPLPIYNGSSSSGIHFNPGGIMIIRRVGVLSLAKFFGILYACMGLLAGLLMSGLSILGVALSELANSSGYRSYSSGGFGDITGIFTGIGAVICMPILYGVLGFIAGIISALFANLALKLGGGLEFEVADRLAGPVVSTPLPPIKA
jgi:hypothetical protein